MATIDVEVLERPDLLLMAGWPIAREAIRRRGDMFLNGLDEAGFRRQTQSAFATGKTLILVAKRRGCLVGYCESHAIECIAY